MKQSRIATALVTLALVLTIAAPSAWGAAKSPKVAADLQDHMLRSGEHRVIVTYAPGFGETELEAVRACGGTVNRRLDGLRGFAGTVSSSEIDRLAADPRVLTISPDRKVLGSMDVSVPRSARTRSRRTSVTPAAA